MTTSSRLVEMAREIEKRKPGALPKFFFTIDDQCVFATDGPDHRLPNDIAAAVLRDAMVMSTRAVRLCCPTGWDAQAVNDSRWVTAFDSDHGNDATESCFAAFCAATGASGPQA